MGDAKHTNRFYKPVVAVIAAAGLVMAFRTGQDGDIGFGFDSGALAAVPISQAMNKAANRDIVPPAAPPLTVVATTPKPESQPVKQGQRIPTAAPTDGPAIVKSKQEDAPVLAVKPVKPVQAETAGLMAKAGSPDQTLKSQPHTKAPDVKNTTPSAQANPAGKHITVLASQFSGLAGTEKVYEHVSDKPAYCMLGLKPGEICPDDGMNAAQIHKTYFILHNTAKINPDQARALLETSVSNGDLTKAGIIIVQFDKLDEMGRLLLSEVYSDKGTKSTWYDPETGIETQRQIANKNEPYTHEQYVAGKWVPVKSDSRAGLRLDQPSTSTLTAGM